MSDNGDERRAEIERDARRGRRFTLADAIGREGARFFDGESPVPMLARVTAGLSQFVDRHVADSSGALRAVLKRKIRTSEHIVGEHFDDPLVGLEIIVEQLLGTEARLHEFVRQVDAEWGRIMFERPHFQQPGQAPHPDDEHTHEGVRAELESLLDKLSQTE
jgi:hypothetical protein